MNCPCVLSFTEGRVKITDIIDLVMLTSGNQITGKKAKSTPIFP